MTYCEYFEHLIKKATYLGQRLFTFHLNFGKQYGKQLFAELKEIQIDKNN
uniref:Uncharacterized protein n=1 Tax=viral metagenome TaxID=1070528 RepID=A0A6C0KX90_9ZZZZ